MASIVQLKRSALSGKVPDTGSLNLGELAVNTYDGKIYFKKSGSIESVESILTTNSVVTGSIRLEGTGSFGSLKVNDTLTVNHGVSVISGSLGVTSDLTVLGQINARQFNISVISSSTLFESGSSNFGNSSDDIHTFTGSVNITGSFLLNGQEVGGGTTTGSFTGSFTGDGSGLRGVVSDDLPIDGWDYNSNSSASISEFNNESRKYLIDFQWDSEVGTPVGFKTFISNVTGSSQIIPTEAGIKFIVGNQQVALVGPNGIESIPPAGTVSGSSQLTSSYDTRYVLSGSITQTTWDNIASKPSGIVSGSSQVIGILDSLNTYTASVSTASLVASITNLNTTTASLNTSVSNLNTFSGSQLSKDSTLATYTGSVEDRFSTLATLTGSNAIRLTNLETFSGSQLDKDLTLATYTGSVDDRFTSLATTTGSLITSASNLTQRVGAIETVSGTFARTNSSNTFFGTQTFSGSLYIANDLIVQGSSSIQNISASSVSIGTNIVRLNTANPSVRFAGLTIIDSGSVGGSGSFLYDSVQDEFIFVHRGNGTNVTSSHFVQGPQTYDDLGNELYLTNNRLVKGTGLEHIVDSNITDTGTLITLGSNTSVSGILTATGFTGSLASTNGVVSGSSQVIGILSSLNTYTGSNDTTNTTQNSRLDQLSTASGSAITRLSTLEVETANLETFTSSINTTIKTRLNVETVVSGSSQVDVMSTTNIARLATTGSNTFTGTISINSGTTGFLTLGASNSYGSISSGGSGATIYLNGATRGGTTTAASNTIVVATDGEFYITNGAANSTKFLIASNGNATLSGTFTENSSIRYKENVETIKYGLDKVLQMRGVTYDKKDNGIKEMGVIAEEVYDVLPEVVLKNEEGEIDSVSYGRITAVLIEAIKDLKKEIEELKANR